MKKKKTIWQCACDHESNVGGGMTTIFNFLASLHATTPEAQSDLQAAWNRLGEQWEAFAQWGPK